MKRLLQTVVGVGVWHFLLLCGTAEAQFPVGGGGSSVGTVTETNLQRITCLRPDTESTEGDDDYVIAYDPPITTNYNGLCVLMTPDVANSGEATLDAGVGPKPILTLSGDTPPDNSLMQATDVQLAYNATADAFLILTGPTSIFNTTVNNYYDLPETAPPSNPGMGKGRLFLHSDSGKLHCVDSSGAGCTGPNYATVLATSDDAHTTNNTYEDINALSVTVTPTASGALACFVTAEIEAINDSTNWNHHELRLVLDGSTNTVNIAAFRVDTAPNPTNQDQTMSGHYVFEGLTVASHTVKVQWRSSSGINATFRNRRLTCMSL